MSRILFFKGEQREFLSRVYNEGGLKWPEIAKICNVCERTIRDWRNEKFYMQYEGAWALSQETSIPLPSNNKILPDYWITSKIAIIGARRRYQLYGNPGTPEGRRKGGINSQIKFRENPIYAKKLGIKIRRKIKKPKESPLLAEFFGVVLGDGGISKYQIRITFNAVTDKEYALYIQRLVKRLFGLSPSILLRSNQADRAGDVLIPSKNLVEFLLNKGLLIGDKIRNNIDISCWIKRKKDYKIACIRGLMDTDGSFYSYKHRVNGKEYCNFGICFTNRCKPLLHSVYSGLKDLGFKPSRSIQRVYLHRRTDINNYMEIIGSHNPKHINKYMGFFRGRGTEAAITGSPRKRFGLIKST